MRTSTNNSHVNHHSSRRAAGLSRRARLALVAICTVAGVGFSAGHAAAGAESRNVVIPAEATCPKDGKIDTPDGPASVSVTAPDGMLIAGYCVKAGSANQGLGPESFNIDPPVKEITFSHTSGKAISHYTVFYVDEPIDDKAPPPTTDEPNVPDDKAPPPTTDEPNVPDDKDGPNPDQPDQPDQPEDTQPEVPADTQPEVPADTQPEAPQPSGDQSAAPQVEVGPPTLQDVPPSLEVPEDVQLPSTGTTTDVIALMAGAAVAAGAAGVWAARRRTASANS